MKDKINEIIDNSIKFGENVGSNCMVFHHGKELFSGSFGHSDREAGVPMTDDKIFRLFSLTKPVTAAAVMILIDRGILSPDDCVSRYFPEYSDLRYVSRYAPEGGVDELSQCTKELKIHHLLTMTSGIPYAHNWCEPVRASARLFDALIDDQTSGENKLTTEEFTRRAAGIPLMWEPGEKWDYGISADILGGIVEKASGIKYGEFLKKNIFEPLGMNDTGFYVPEEKLSRFAALYSWQDGRLTRDNGNYLGLTDYKAPPAFESGGAGLVSTIRDYSRFALMLCSRGELDGVRVISEDSFRYMTSPKLSEKQRSGLWDRLDGYNYACLMRVMENAEISQIKTANGEFGWDGWTGTYFCADPENSIVVLYFTQICGAGTTKQAELIDEAVYEKLVRE